MTDVRGLKHAGNIPAEIKIEVAGREHFAAPPDQRLLAGF